MRASRCALAIITSCALATALAQVPTTTSLTITSAGAPVSTIQQDTTVTLMATVSLAGAGTPALPPGQVNFCDAAPPHCTDIHLLGTAQLSKAGTATMGLLPGPGSHTYQAYFVGTHLLAPSLSAGGSITVTPFSLTTTTIAATGSPSNYWLTATVTNSLPTPPTGSVSFHDLGNSGYTLGTAQLVPVTSTGLSFVQGPQIALSAGCTAAIAEGDFNNDGRPDLLTAPCPVLSGLQFYPLTMLLGNGDATFRDAPYATGVAASPQSLAVADFNGDGNQDVAAAMNLNNTVQIVLGNGDGTFTSKQVLSIPSPQAIVSADFNGDGIPDLAVTSVTNVGSSFAPNTVTILLGGGDGTFAIKGSPIPTGIDPSSIVAADFNHDGKLDLAITNQADNTLTILLGNGDGTFTSAATPQIGVQPDAIAAADFNGDGIPDLAVLNYQNVSGPAAPGSVTILLSNGDGTFTPAGATSATGPSPVSIAVGDFNADGKVDLAIADSAITNPNGIGQVSILLGNGDGTFAPEVNVPAAMQGADPRSLAVADFNAAGVADIAVGVYDGLDSTILPQIGSEAVATIKQISLVGSGPRAVDAAYPGDASDGPSTSPSIEIYAQLVTPTLTLTVNPAIINYGQQSLLTVTLTPDPAEDIVATGYLDISYAGIANRFTLTSKSSNVVTLTMASPPVGTYSITASYTGDYNFAPTTGSTTITVNALATNTSVTSSLNPAGFGQSVTFTATVTSPTGPPGGSILFSDGATTLASVPLAAGGTGSTASFTTSTLAQGTHTITATYLPATGYASGSAMLTQVITAAVQDFSISIANPTQTLQDGQNSTTTITLTSLNGFADTIALACGNLPSQMTCTFAPNSTRLAANAKAAVSLNLNTYIPLAQGRDSGLPAPASAPILPLSLAFLLPPVGLLTSLATRRRLRNSIFGLLLLAAFMAMISLSGCGEIIYPLLSAAPGTYTIPITATGSNTGQSHTAQITLTINP